MQISRHWRLKNQRYRLQGVKYPSGEVALLARMLVQSLEPSDELRHQAIKQELELISHHPERK